GRFSVGFAANLLHLAVSRGLDLVQVAFFLPGNAGRFAFAFGSKPGRNLPAFADHSLINAIEHVRIVIDALEPDVEQVDAELGQFPGGFRVDLVFDFLSPELDGWQDADCSQAVLDTVQL